MTKSFYYHRLFVDAAVTLGAMAILKIMAVLVSVTVARILGPEGLGIFQLIASLINFLLLTAVFGLPITLTKHLSETPDDDLRKTNISIIVLSLVLFFSTVIATGTFIFSGWISNIIYHRPDIAIYIKIGSAAIILLALNVFVNSWLQGFQLIKRLSILTTANAVLGSILIIALVYYYHSTGAILSMSATSFTFMVLFVILNLPLLRDKFKGIVGIFDKKITVDLLRTSIPNYFNSIITAALPMLLALILSYQGIKKVGFYAVSNTIYQALLFIPMAITVPLLPAVSNLHKDCRKGVPKLLENTLMAAGLLELIISIIIAMASSVVVNILYGKAYGCSLPLVLIFIATAFVASINILIHHYLAGIGRFWESAGLNFLMFGIVITIALVMTPVYGIVWIGYGLLIAYVAATGIALWYLNKKREASVSTILKLSLGWGIVYSIAFLLNNLGHQRLSFIWLALSMILILILGRGYFRKIYSLVMTKLY